MFRVGSLKKTISAISLAAILLQYPSNVAYMQEAPLAVSELAVEETVPLSEPIIQADPETVELGVDQPPATAPQTGEGSITMLSLPTPAFEALGADDELPVITLLTSNIITINKDVPVTVEFTASDNLTASGDLSISAATDNAVLFPDNFTLVNNGGACQATGTPSVGAHGSAVLMITVEDAAGNKSTAPISITVADNYAPVAASDVAETNEDTPVVVNVLANDSDADDDQLTVALVTNAAHGTAALSDAGTTVTYTPDAGFFGADSFTYQVQDTSGATSAVVTVALTVVEVIDGPVITVDETDWAKAVTLTLSGTTPTGGTVWYSIDAGDWQQYTDAVQLTVQGAHTVKARFLDGAGVPSKITAAAYKLDQAAPVSAISVVLSGDEASGTVTITASDPLSGVRELQYAAGVLDEAAFLAGAGTVYTAPFVADVHTNYTIYAVDNCGNSALQVFQIGTRPTITGLEAEYDGQEDAELTFGFTVSDSETASGSLQVAVTADNGALFPHAFTVENADGTCVVTVTPGANQHGSATLTVTVTDGLLTSSATAAVEIAAVDDPPVAANDAAATDEETPVIINLLGNDSDVEGDAFVLVSVTDPTHGTVVREADGTTVTYTPDLNFFGVDTFTYTIGAPSGSSTSTVTVTVANTDDAPVAVPDNAETDKNKPIAIDVLANDLDLDLDGLTIEAIIGLPAHGTVTIASDKKMLTYTPELQWYGTDSFTYSMTDGSGVTVSATVTVVVNYKDYPPQVPGLGAAYDVAEDSSLTVSFALDDSETSASSITAQVMSSNTSIIKNEQIVVTGLADADPAIVLEITPEPNQYGQVTITIRASDGFNIGTYTFVVNVTPVNDAPVAKNDSVSFTEDTQITFTASDLLGNDTDLEHDVLSIAGIESTVTQGTLVYDAPTGVFTYTPELNAETNATFTYRVFDGELASDNVATVTLVCQPLNDKPWVAAIADQATAEDTTITDIAFTIGDPEIAASLLVIAVGSSNQSVVSDAKITCTGDGADRALTIVPNENGYGETTISVTVSDGEYYVTRSFKLTVTAVQDLPSAVDDIASVAAGASVTIAVLQNDYDVDGDALGLISISDPAQGTLVVNPDGTVTYAAASGYSGIDSFTYNISDGKGNFAQATVRIACTVKTHNPVLTRISNQQIAEDSATPALSFSALDEVDLASLVITAASSNTAVIPNTGLSIVKINDSQYAIAVTPAADQSGVATITVQAVDSKGYSTSVSFTVTVYPVNDPPSAADQNITINEDTAATFTIAGDWAADLESSILLHSMGEPAQGVLVINGSEYTYTPPRDWHGVVTFPYSIMDAEGATATAQITITVAPVNDPPVARDDARYNVDFAAPITINVLANDSDVDLDTLSLESCSDHTATLNADGSITFWAKPGQTSDFSCTYTITDNGSPAKTATATIYLSPNPAGPGGGDYDLYAVQRTVNEDSGALSIDLSGSISNFGGATLAVSLYQLPTLGTASIAGNIVTYTPGANNNGTDVFYYQVTDGSVTKQQKITIYILPVNDAPTISAVDDIAVDEDAPIGEVTVSIADVDNPTADLEFAIGSSQQSVLSSDEITVTRVGGAITLAFHPSEHANGSTVVTMTVSDGIAYVDRPFGINIGPINDAPTAEDFALTLSEDADLQINPLTYPCDPDIADVLTVTIEGDGPTHGTVGVDANGIMLYRPNANYHGSDSFQYRITDADGDFAVGDVTLTITPAYDPTRIENLVSTVSVPRNNSVPVTFDIPNPDNAVISVVAESQNVGLVKNDATGLVLHQDGTHYTLTVTPVTNASGNTLVVIKANDGTQDYTAVFTLQVTASATGITANEDSYTINEDTATVFNVVANDLNPDGGALSVIGYTNPEHGTVTNNMNGTVTYRPSANYNSGAGLTERDLFTYTVTNVYGVTAQATVYVTITPVNDGPTAVIDQKSIAEDTPFTLNVLANDSDIDGDAISLLGITQPAHGTATFDALTGTVSYTPDANYSGLDSFTYTITDGKLESVGTVAIAIGTVNDAPVVGSTSGSWTWELDEDTSQAFSVTITDPESPSKNLLVRITSTNKALIADSNIKLVGSDGNYQIQLKPSPNANGELWLNIEVNDGVNTTEQPVKVIVRPVNDPVSTTNQTVTMNEDSVHLGQLTATDVEDTLANLTFAAKPGFGPTHGSVTVNADGSWSYTPDLHFHGADSFAFTVSDRDGSAAEGSVNITVNPVNDTPIAAGDSAGCKEDTAVTIAIADLLANDTDADRDRGEADAISFLSATNGQHGQVVVSPDGLSLTYTPAANWNGTDSFQYRVTDSAGATATGTVTVTVTPLEDDPAAVNDAITIAEDAGAKVLNVLANDQDPDIGMPSDAITIKAPLVYDPASIHGTLAITGAGKTVTYTPDAHWHGQFTFDYTIEDLTGRTSTATVTVTVSSVNDAPVATADSATTNEDTSVEISVLSNDSDVDRDIYDKSDALTVKSVTQGSHGTVTSSGTTVTYTPAANWNGTDSFQYTVRDKAGATATAKVTVTVMPVEDDSTAVNDALTLLEDAGATVLNVLANDQDPDIGMPSDAITIKAPLGYDPASIHGTLEITGGGTTVTYTPEANWHGSFTFSYTIEDQTHRSSTATATVTVTPVNDAPAFTKGADQTVLEDCGAQTVSGWATGMSAGQYGESSQSLTFVITTNNNALFSVQPAIAADGKLTFTPKPNAYGTATVTVKLRDNGGTGNGGVDSSTEQTFTITIIQVNDAPSFTKGTNRTVLEDCGAQALSGWATSISRGPNDPTSQVLTFNLSNDNNALFSVQPAIAANGKLTFTPAPNANGMATVTVMLSDDGGTANGGVDTSAIQTFTIAVTAVNDAPSFIKGDDQTRAEDSGPQVVAGWASGFATGPVDEAGQNLTFNVSNDNNALFSVQPSVAADGTLTFTSAANANGSATVTVTLNDDGGTANGGVDVCVKTMLIQIAAVNDAPVAVADAFALGEDAAFTLIDVLANDTDVDVNTNADKITIFAAGPALHGTLTISADRTQLFYQPHADWNGAETFSYVITDRTGVTATATVTVTVGAVNDAPVVTGGTAVTGNEDAAAITGKVTAADVDGDALTFSKASDPSHGTVTVNADGSYSYTPNPNFQGSDSFDVQVSDGKGGTVTATVTVTVNQVNDAPVASDSSVSCNEDAVATGSVTASDVDGDALTFSKASDPSHGSVTVNPNGSYTYTPAANYHGSDSFTVSVSDGKGGTDTATVTVTVVAVNDAPVVTGGTAVTGNEDAAAITGKVTATDLDGDALTFSKASDPSHGAVTVNADGSYAYTPNPDFQGTDTFTALVSDGNGGIVTATVTVTVSPQNDAPVASDASVSCNEDTSATGSVTATDVDGDTLTFTKASDPSYGSVAVNANGSYTYTPAANYHGADSFTVSVSDGKGETDTAIVTVTVVAVNDAPVAVSDSLTMGEEAGATVIGVLSNDTDADIATDGDEITILAAGPAAHGILQLSPDGKALTYQPHADWYGTETFSYTIRDLAGATSTATVTVTVNQVNDPPVASDASASCDEDSVTTGSVTATDVDGDSLTFSKSSDPSHGSVTVNSDGSYTYTPSHDYHGSDSFTVLVSDGNDGTDTATVSVTVGALNDAPVASDSSVSCNEDTNATGSVTATDVDGDALIFSKGSDPTHGTVVVSGDGSYIYTPALNYHGNDSFTVSVSDGKGGTATVTVAVTVNPANDTPVVTGGTTANGNEDAASITGKVTANDVDGDALTFAKTSDPSHGSVTVNTDGSYTYTPNPNFQGTDTFTVSVSDGNGGTVTVTVTVTVNQVNDAPVASDSSVSCNEDAVATGSVTATDVDGDALTFSKASDPSHGSVMVNPNGSYTYTPTANYHGSDSFTVSVSDGKGGTDTAMVSVMVSAVNDAPVATNDHFSMDEEAGATVIGVLGNDTDADVITDGDEITILAAGPAAHGTLQLSPDRKTLTYRPHADWNGIENFSYTITDLAGATSTATVTVTVNQVNDAPVASDASVSRNEDAVATGSVTASDVDGDPLTFSKASDPSHGTVTVGSDGTYSYTPNLNFHGSDSFDVSVSDGNGGTVTVTVTVTVNPQNDAPVATDSNVSCNEDAVVTGSVTATDVDGDALTFSKVSDPSHGSVTVASNGSYTYTPAANYYGSDSFDVQVSDGNGAIVAVTVNVNVNSVNDAPSFIMGSDKTVGENTGAKSYVGWATNITCGPINEASQTVSFTVTNDNNSLFDVQPAVDVQGKLFFTLRPNQYGVAVVTVVAQDDGGIERGGVDQSPSQTFTITVIKRTELVVTGTIRGMTEVGTESVENAQVQLLDLSGQPLPGKIDLSEADGSYRITGITEGRYILEVTCSGYSYNSRMVEISFARNEAGVVTEDFLLADFVLSLTSDPSAILGNGTDQSLLTATVLDRFGNPIEGVGLAFSATDGSFPGGITAITDADGLAKVWYQSANLAGVNAMYVPVTVTVNDPVHRLYGTACIFVTFAPGFIEGVVTDGVVRVGETQGRPVAGAIVTVYKDFDGDGITDFSFTQTTGPDGKYKVAIPVGGVNYDILIQKPMLIGNSMQQVTVHQNANASAITGGGDQFDSEKTVTGVVVLQGSHGSASIISDLAARNITLELIHPDGTVQDITLTMNSTTGTFSATNLPRSGDYRIVVKYNVGGQQIIAGYSDVHIGVNGEVTISQVLIDPYGTITEQGTGNPLRNVLVELYYYDKPGTLVPLPPFLAFPPADNANPQQSDVNGQYAFMVFPHTDYYLVARRAGYYTYTSPKITVGTEIVKWDFAMVREASGGGGGGSVPPVGVVDVDMSINLESDALEYREGDEVNVSISYQNKSAQAASGTQVSLQLAPQFTAVNYGDGVLSGDTITWTLGQVPGATGGTLTLQLKVNDLAESYAAAELVAKVFGNYQTSKPDDDRSTLNLRLIADTLYHVRYLAGYPDGTFKPGNSITRAEIAAIYARVAHLEGLIKGENRFADVRQNHWAQGAIEAVVKQGIFTHYPDGGFHPDDGITRAELAVTICNYLGLVQSNPDELHYNDIAKHWARNAIEAVYRYGIISDLPGGRFRPGDKITRAEAVTMINGLLQRGPLDAPTSTWPDVPLTHPDFGQIEEASSDHHFIKKEDGREQLVEDAQ